MSLGSSTPGGPVDLEGVNIGIDDGGGLFDSMGGLFGGGGLNPLGSMPGFAQTNQSSARSTGYFDNKMGGSMTVIGGGNGDKSLMLLFGAGALLYFLMKGKK